MRVIVGIVPAIGIGFFSVDDDLVIQFPFIMIRFINGSKPTTK